MPASSPAAFLAEDRRDIGLLAVTAADRLNAGWTTAERARQRGRDDATCHVERLLGGVHGHRVKSLGVEHFGQTGTIADLYRHHGIDANAIVHAAQAVSPGRTVRYLRSLPA